MSEAKKEEKKENIHQTLVRIQQSLKAPKNQFNKFSNFYYRSCEDILEAVKPLLDGCSITIQDKVVMLDDRFYVEATVKLHDGKDYIETTAFAREALVKKGMDESQITGATSSYARKYALNGLFAIDDTKDADTKDADNKPARKLSSKENAEEASRMIKAQKDSKSLAQWRKKISGSKIYTKEQKEKLILEIDEQVKNI